AAARVNGQLLVVHGGMVAVVERPRVRAQFDSKEDVFSHEELADVLGAHFADRPEGETFAAAEVLGLRRGGQEPH
ncbi:short chain dehydrogenase, partial [Streptomyces sp. MBT97]|nr:short chain dehydrogenase [Streptomyces sp. MBT97]